MTGGRTHRPVLDRDRCLSCSVCTWRCPAAVFPDMRREEGSLRGAAFSARPYPGAPAEAPPCRAACPLGQDVPSYVSAIARGDLEAAARIVRETNALPSICGRVCVASCMRACIRASIDEGVDIRGLKRFAAEAVCAATPEPAARPGGSRSVAVVGAGPAGLAAAHRLAQLGISPVVHEAGPRAGGMLVQAAAEIEMPAARVAADVEHLESVGVEIRTGIRAGEDVPWSGLEEGFDAVLVATGARLGLVPRVPGRDLEGVTDAVSFGSEIRAGEREAARGPAVVHGGGKAALMTARAAIRLGAAPVRAVHFAPREQWPAGEDDIRLAEDEGVEILPLRRLIALEGEGGRLSGARVSALEQIGADGVGRARLADPGRAETIPATLFVAARDRRSREEDLPRLEGVETGRLRNLAVDPSYRLGRRGWYAAGEAVTGTAGVVDSMATGRLAAEAIAADLEADDRRER